MCVCVFVLGCVGSPGLEKRPLVVLTHREINYTLSLGGGHYTAYGKNNVDNKWYYFNDSSVSLVQDESRVRHGSVRCG